MLFIYSLTTLYMYIMWFYHIDPITLPHSHPDNTELSFLKFLNFTLSFFFSVLQRIWHLNEHRWELFTRAWVSNPWWHHWRKLFPFFQGTLTKTQGWEIITYVFILVLCVHKKRCHKDNVYMLVCPSSVYVPEIKLRSSALVATTLIWWAISLAPKTGFIIIHVMTVFIIIALNQSTKDGFILQKKNYCI